MQLQSDGDVFAYPPEATVVELLQWRARRHPDRPAFIFLPQGEAEGGRITYGELDQKARRIASALLRRADPRSPVLLMHDPGLEFIVSFWGTLYAGMIAVPCYPPEGMRAGARFAKMAGDVGASLGITEKSVASRVASAAQVAGLAWFPSEELALAAEDALLPRPAPDWSAVLQYTSGSTLDPKGVELTLSNLRATIGIFVEVADPENPFATRQIITADPRPAFESFVSWLPHSHDMGLFGKIVYPVALGASTVMMPPSAFLQRPARWLHAIGRYRGTLSASPNFGYDLCAKKVAAADLAGVDLSSWRVGINAAETVRAETFRRFEEQYAPCGLRPGVIVPSYGLAEATLVVTGNPPSTHRPTLVADRTALAAGRVEVVENGATLVACGTVKSSHEVAIVDPGTFRRCEPHVIGEIWVRGPTVARGYWRREDATRELLRAKIDGEDAHYLRTGDLGFFDDGRLFITGRIKELVIVRGQNHYPEDIETTVVEQSPLFRRGGGAAFAVDGDREERLVVVQEIERGARAVDVAALKLAATQAVVERHGLALHALILVEAGAVPRTTSGKRQRGRCRDLFLAGKLQPWTGE